MGTIGLIVIVDLVGHPGELEQALLHDLLEAQLSLGDRAEGHDLRRPLPGEVQVLVTQPVQDAIEDLLVIVEREHVTLLLGELVLGECGLGGELTRPGLGLVGRCRLSDLVLQVLLPPGPHEVPVVARPAAPRLDGQALRDKRLQLPRAATDALRECVLIEPFRQCV